MELKQLIQNKGLRLFLALYSCFFLIGAGIILFTERGDVVLFINRYSRIEWDGIVNFITNIGLGGYMAILAILLAVWRVRYAASALLSLLFVSVFTNVLKELFKSSGWTRPLHHFLYDDFSRFIYTAEINYYSTFPSGHSMAIFSMMAMLAFIIGNRTASVFLFILAVLVGFSRMYLLQHFFIDVYTGALLGVISSMLAWWITETKMPFLHRGYFNRSVFSLNPTKNS